MHGYRFVSRRMRRDGSEELVADRQSVSLALPAYPVIREVLGYLQRGERPPERLGYKLAVLCLRRLKGRHPLFENCNDCFFRDVCAYPRNPQWFHKRGLA